MLFKFYNALTNASGDALVGYIMRLFDSTGAAVPLYADESMTPIITESGIADAAVSDDDGMIRFYVESGTYDIRKYDRNDVFVAPIEAAVPMIRGVSDIDLSGETGATLVGTPTGTVQADLDAATAAIAERPTTADLASPTGAEMVGFEQDAAGSALRNASAKLAERLSINDFTGADPTGVGDSTAAIVAALARGSATGQPVNVDGVYRYTAQIEVPTHVRIVGFGHTSDPGTRGKSCFLKDFNSGTEAAFILAGYDAMVTDVHFDSVDGRSGDLVQMASERQVIENCSFTHAGRDGLRIGNDAMVANANLWRVVGVYCLANGRHGIFIDDPTEPPDANAGCLISADCRGNLSDGIRQDTGLWNTFINPVCQGNKGVGFRLTANSRACNILGGDIEANGDPVTNPDNIQGLIENGALGNKIDAPLFGTGKWTNEAPQGTNKVSYYDSNFSLIVDGDILSVANPRSGGEALINLYADTGLDLFGQIRAKKVVGSGGGVEIWTKPNGNIPAKAIGFTDKQNCEFTAGLIEKSAAVTYGTGPYIEPLKYSWATMTVTDAVAYSPYIEPSGATAGQVLRITIKNTTGGAIAAGSYSPAKLSGPIQPGAGKAISVDLRFDGTTYIEVSRSAEVTL